MNFKKINKLSPPLPGLNTIKRCTSKPRKLKAKKNWVDYQTVIMAEDMQRFEEAAEKVSANLFGNFVSVKNFGAKGDGIADDTLAFTKAFESLPKYSTLFVPSGIYKGNFVFQFQQVFGSGDTTFIAQDINKPIIILRDPIGWDYQTFRDCKIDGQNKATPIQLGINATDRYAGRWLLKNISLSNSKEKGVHKIGGNIGVHWEECDFNDNPIHYYAHNESGETMHVGCDTFYKCHFGGATKAVWYYKENDNTGKEEGGQIIIRDCIAEGNNNAAVLIADNFGKGCVPIVVENLWLEQNSKAPNTMVNINGKNYKARELHIENVGKIKISGTYIHSSYFKNSNVVIDGCEISDSYMSQNYFVYNQGVQLENDNSNVVINNSYTRCGWSQIDNDKTPITVRNHESETSYVTKGMLGYYSSQPNNIEMKGKQNIIPIYVNKLDNIDKAIQFEGNRIISTIVKDGVMGNTCIEFEAVKDGGWTHRELTPMLQNYLGKYIVMTFSIKAITTNNRAILKLSGGSGDLGELRFKKTGEWNHYRLCFYVGEAYSQHGNLGFWFDESPVGFKFRMQNLQILAFNNLNEANAFIDNGYFFSEETESKETLTINYTKYELSNSKIKCDAKIKHHKKPLEWTGGSVPYGHVQLEDIIDEDTGETLTKYRIPEPNAYTFRPYIFNSGDNGKWCLFRVELKFLNLNEDKNIQLNSGSGNEKSGTIRYKSSYSGLWRTYYSMTKIRDDMATHPFNTGFYFVNLPIGTEFLVRSYTMSMFNTKQEAIDIMENNLIMI